MRKVLIFVEGQTEQILLNQLIQVWWNYSNVEIRNIKLITDQNEIAGIRDFVPPTPAVFFLIVNVAGDGSLPSAIAKRAAGFQSRGYDEVFALRDLFSQDFEKLTAENNREIESEIRKRFRNALETMGFSNSPNLHFSVMEIEAWMLAFSGQVIAWGSGTTFDQIQSSTGINIQTHDLESIKRPSSLMEQIAGLCRVSNPKSLDAVTRFVSSISREDITSVIASSRVPRFSTLWSELTGAQN